MFRFEAFTIKLAKHLPHLLLMLSTLQLNSLTLTQPTRTPNGLLIHGIPFNAFLLFNPANPLESLSCLDARISSIKIDPSWLMMGASMELIGMTN